MIGIRNMSGLALVFLIGTLVTGLEAQDELDLFSNSLSRRTPPTALSAARVLSGAASKQSPTRQLQLQTDQLVNELRKAFTASTGAEKKAAAKVIESTEERLRTVVGQQFDELMKGREDQVKQLQERVKRLDIEIKKSRDAKQKIVELRLQTLMNEANGLGFPSASRSTNQPTPFQPGVRGNWSY